MAKRATVSDLFSKKPLTATVELVLDGSVADKWAEVKANYDAAKRQVDVFGPNEITSAELAKAEKAYKALRPKIEAATVELEMTAIGRLAYNELQKAHPATDEQIAEARKENANANLAYDYETFPAALLARSLTDPKMSEDEVKKLMSSENYNAAELAKLVNTALEVNQTSKDADLGKDSE